jgi:sortase (surface protein transpeptidase)
MLFLSLPKIRWDAITHEGPDDSTLNLRVWRKPASFDPEQGGNTVLTAHKFLHTCTKDAVTRIVVRAKLIISVQN